MSGLFQAPQILNTFTRLYSFEKTLPQNTNSSKKKKNKEIKNQPHIQSHTTRTPCTRLKLKTSLSGLRESTRNCSFPPRGCQGQRSALPPSAEPPLPAVSARLLTQGLLQGRMSAAAPSEGGERRGQPPRGRRGASPPPPPRHRRLQAGRPHPPTARLATAAARRRAARRPTPTRASCGTVFRGDRRPQARESWRGGRRCTHPT